MINYITSVNKDQQLKINRFREREIILLRSIVNMMIHTNKNYNEGLCGLIQGDLR